MGFRSWYFSGRKCVTFVCGILGQVEVSVEDLPRMEEKKNCSGLVGIAWQPWRSSIGQDISHTPGTTWQHKLMRVPASEFLLT